MKIALGTANFGQKYGLAKKNINSKKEIKKILKFSNISNIKIIDTSGNYGSGESLLGSNDLKNFKVITKLKISAKEKKKDSLESIVFNKIKTSLLKLNIKKLYAILLHSSDDLKYKKKYVLIKALKKLKKKNLVSKIGVSIYDPKELDFIWSFWKPDIVQCPFNILDQRIYKSGWLEKLKKNKIEIHVRSIFLQGLLLKDEKLIPKKFKKWKNIFRKLNVYCKNENITKIEACINFIKSFRKISYVVIGFENNDQIKAAIKNFKSKNKKYPSLMYGDEKLINPRLW